MGYLSIRHLAWCGVVYKRLHMESDFSRIWYGFHFSFLKPSQPYKIEMLNTEGNKIGFFTEIAICHLFYIKYLEKVPNRLMFTVDH